MMIVHTQKSKQQDLVSFYKFHPFYKTVSNSVSLTVSPFPLVFIILDNYLFRSDQTYYFFISRSNHTA